MLALDDVHSLYGNIHALKGVSLEVGEGELVSLIGANGAGKSTTLRTISGLLAPRSGRVLFRGESIAGESPGGIVRRGIAHCPEERKIWPQMTVLEHLEIGAYTRSDTAGIGEDLERVFAYFPRLRERRGQMAGTLSGGEQQMLAIGRALLTNGRLLLLDEPSEGLAPLIVREIGRVVKGLKGERLSILLVEQNYHLALQVADRVYVMNKGQIVWDGTPAALEANEDVKRRYLGVA